MMPFFNRTGLERIGVVGPKIGLLLGWSAGSGCGCFIGLASSLGLASGPVSLIFQTLSTFISEISLYVNNSIYN